MSDALRVINNQQISLIAPSNKIEECIGSVHL